MFATSWAMKSFPGGFQGGASDEFVTTRGEMMKKAKKSAQSATLFWIGILLTLLGAVLQLINPTASLVSFIIVVVGAALSGWQKIVGDEEHSNELEQERERADASAQAIAQNEAAHAPESILESNLNKRD